jgi:hypothetical protein
MPFIAKRFQGVNRLKKTVCATIIFIVLLAISIMTYSYYPISAKEKEVNVCLHLSDYSNTTISYLKDLKVGWVRTDWILTPDGAMENYCQELQRNNINLLTIFDTNTFGFQNFSLREWNNTITEIVKSPSFQSVDAVEIWNEPNGAAYIDPETYYEMLKSAYVIIKSHSSVPIIFAGISPNIPGWQTYLNQIFAHYDTEDNFDFMGIHLYDDVTTNLNTLQFIKGLTDKPIWLTETGKPSENNDQAAQATYLYSVYSNSKSLVSKFFIYELNDNYGLTPEKENHFGLVQLNGTKKESYYMVWETNRK